MNTQEIINSGDLEAYVCGALSLEESRRLTTLIDQDEALQTEVQHIENVFFKLASGLAPALDEIALYEVLRKYVKEHQEKENGFDWSPYLGWAAALVLFIGSGYLFYQNTGLNEQIVGLERTEDILNSEIEQLDALTADYQEALAFVKNPNTIKINLPGQGDYANANAVAFHNPEQGKTYVDVSNLPTAPENMTYQLWSLTLNPLTPTSLGTIASADFDLIEFDNQYTTEAFGITLEPAGGSETPTLERLYTLGAIQ